MTTATPNPAPSITNLNGDSVAWAGVGNQVTLDASSDATVSDAEFDALNGGAGDWSGGSLTVNRAIGGSANPIANDVFGFGTSGASFTVSGNELQSGGLTFATFTNTGGVLTITFTSSATLATTTLVQDVTRHITYQNDTPYGDATIRFTFSDGTNTTNADVTVTSDTIYVTNATDTGTIDITTGVSFSEAIAIAAADTTGTQTVVVAGSVGSTLSTSAASSLNENLTLDLSQDSGVTVSGGTLSISVGNALTVTNDSGDTATIATSLSGSGGLTKSGAGTLTLTGTNTYTGATTVSAGTLVASGGSAIGDTSAVTVASGANLKVSTNETIGNLASAASDSTVTLDGASLTTRITADTTFAGTITGAGGLTLSQTGAATHALTLSGTNDFTGGTTLANYAALKLSGGSALSDTGALQVNGNSVLTLLDSETIGSLAGTGGTASVVLGTSTLTAGGNNGSTTFAGVISGSGGLDKTGTGTLTLTGTNNGSSATTTITAGTLSIGAARNLMTGTLTLAGGTLEVAGSSLVLLGNAVAITADSTVKVDLTGSAKLYLTGTLSGTDVSSTLTKSGDGTLDLGGTTNRTNYLGKIKISAGTLSVSRPTNLGAGQVTVDNATLYLAGSGIFTNNIVLNGDATIKIPMGAGVQLSGTISGDAGTVTLDGGGGLGNLNLTGINTFTATTLLIKNLVVLQNGYAVVDTQTVTVDSGATLRLFNGNETLGGIAGSGTVDFTSYILTVDVASGTDTFGGTLSGADGRLTKTGAGTLSLTGTNSYTGATTVSAGTLEVSNGSAIGDASAVTVASGATLYVYDNETIGSLAGGGTVTLNSGTLTVGANNSSTEFSGTIEEYLDGALTKTGTGTLTLSGSNTYTGATTVSAGTLLVSNDSALGTTDGATTVASGATLQLGSGVSIGEALTLAGTGISSGGALRLDVSGSATATVSGAVELTADTTVYSGSNDALTLSGVVSGSGALTKSGAGTLTLSGSNTYTGATTVSAGTLVAGSNDALGTTAGGTTISSSGTLQIGSGITVSDALTLAGTLGSSTGSEATVAGTVELTGSATIKPNSSNGVITISGDLSGSGSLTKTGNGTLILSGTSTYTGATTVSAGTLLVNGALSATSSVTVDSGATLGGDGGSIFAASSTSTVTVAGTLSPGTSSGGFGALTINGNLTFGSAGSYVADIGGTGIGTDYDAVLVNGTVTINAGAALNVNYTVVTPGNGDSYRLISNDESDPISGTFASLAEGGSLTANNAASTKLTAYYAATDAGATSGGNEFMLRAPVDQPPTLDLNGNGTTGTGNTVALADAVNGLAVAAEVTDTEGDWTDGTLTVQRWNTTSDAADGSVHDVFSFLSGPGLSFTGSMTEGQDSSGTISDGATQFATWAYTSATGTLVVTFAASATTAQVQALAGSIGYSNATPYGDTTIRFTLTDTYATNIVTADVAVTSSTIYVDQSNDDAGNDAADGFSLREALARGVAQTGADTIIVTLADNSTITLGSGVTFGSGDTLDLDGAVGLTIAGSTITIGASGSRSMTVSVGSDHTATISSAIGASSGSVTKIGAGTLVLGGTNTYSGETRITEGTLKTNSLGSSGSLVLNGGTLTTNGQDLSFANAVEIDNGSTIDLSNGSVRLSGVISGSNGGALTVTSTAAGKVLTLTGNNTFDGGLVFKGGILDFGSNTALGTGTLTIDGGAKIRSTSGSYTLANNLLLKSNLMLAGSYAQTFTGTVDLNGASRTINDGINRDLTFSGVISNGSLTINSQGTGAVVLGGTNGSGYTTTTITGGTLAIAGQSNLGSGAVTIDGSSAVLRLTDDATITAGVTIGASGGTIEVVAAKSATMSGVIDGTGVLTKTGTGTLTLSGSNTFSGATTVSAGTLAAENGAAVSDTATVTIASGATFTLNDDETIGSLSHNGSGDGTIALNGAGLTINQTATATFDGAISGSGTLIKAGADTLTLTGTNSGSDAAIELKAGTLSIGGATNLTTGTLTFNGGTLAATGDATLTNAVTMTAAGTVDVSSTKTLTLNGQISGTGALTKTSAGTLVLGYASGTGNAGSWSGGITISGGTLSIADDKNLGSGSVSLGAGTFLIAGNTTIDNDVDVTDDATIAVAAGYAAELSGVLSGGGAGSTFIVLKSGTGATDSLTLSGTNTYAGSKIQINAGTVIAKGGVAVLDTLVVELGDDATLTLANDETVGGIASTFSTSAIDLDGHTLTVDLAADASFAGGIKSTTSGGGLTKTGAGTLSLTGTNSYTGATTVSAGTLEVSNGSAIGDSSAVTVASGATLYVYDDETIGSLAGDGTVTLNGDTLTVGGDNTSTEFSGTIGEISGSNLTKTGTGTLTLSGFNTYTGTTDISGGTLAVAADSNLGAGSLSFTGGALAVTATTTIDNAITLNNAASNHRSTIDVADGTTATLTGSISIQDSSQVLAKANTGTLVLGSAVGFAGTVELQNGTLSVGATGSLANDTTVKFTTTNGVILEITGSGDFDHDISVGVNGTITVAGSVAVTGVVTQSGGTRTLSKSGTGTLALAGNNRDATNAISNAIEVKQGTLSITDASNLGKNSSTQAGSVKLYDDAVLEVTGTGAVTVDATITLVGSGGTILYANTGASDVLTLSGTIAGSSPSYSLIKDGAGTVVFSGTNTYAGATTVSAGTLVLSGGSAIKDRTNDSTNANTGKVTVADGATLQIDTDETIGALDGAGAVVLGGNTLTITVGTSTNASPSTFTGSISGTGALVKAGSGTEVLSGTNSFTGGTTVSAGTLKLSGGAALADSGAVSVESGATLDLAASETIGALSGAGAITLGANTLTIDQTTDGTLSGAISGTGAVVKQGSATLTLTGTNSYSGGTTVSAGTLAGDTTGLQGDIVNNASVEFNLAADGTYAGALSGTGAVTKSGAGTLTLSGSNTFSGGTEVRDGTLSVGDGSNLSTGDVTLNGGTLTVTGEDVTLANAFTVEQSATVTNANALTLTGVISGSGDLTKSGAGVLTFTGTETYTGATTVSAGTLRVSGALSGTSGVTVANGATLGGTGSIFAASSTNTVTVQSGGTLAPGASPGILTVNGNLSLASATLAVEIDNTTAGTGYDRVVVNGTVDLTGATLALTFADGYVSSPGQSFILIANDLADAITGNFTSVTVGGSPVTVTSDAFVRAGKPFGIDYAGDSGNDLVLNALDSAPVLDTSTEPTLDVIEENVSNAANTGTSVADLVIDGSITDIDGPVEAIAVIAVDDSHGTWQFSTDNGATWTDFGAVSESNARLLDGTLTGDATQKVRFVPDADFFGTATMTLRAWDTFSGTAGGTADATSNGGFTPFSADTVTATITVTEVSLAPPPPGTEPPASLTEPPSSSTASPPTTTGTDGAGDPNSQSTTGPSGFVGSTVGSGLADFGLQAFSGSGTGGGLGGSFGDGGTFGGGTFGGGTGGTPGTGATGGDVGGETGGTPTGGNAGVPSAASGIVARTMPNGGDGQAPALLAGERPADVSFGLGQSIEVHLGAGTFFETDPGATVTLLATLSDGHALPGWLRFDATTGTFSGTPPAGFVGTIEVRVLARDDQGRVAEHRFTITIGAGAQPGDQPPAGEGQPGQTGEAQPGQTGSGAEIQEKVAAAASPLESHPAGDPWFREAGASAAGDVADLAAALARFSTVGGGVPLGAPSFSAQLASAVGGFDARAAKLAAAVESYRKAA